MALPETAKLVFFARKAHGGQKRKLIRAVMNPPSYPATRSRGPVVPPLVDEAPHVCLDRPGRLAPRWLEDFICGELDDDDVQPHIQDVGCANLDFRREAAARQQPHGVPAPPPPPMRHELLLKGHQSFEGDPSASSRRADHRQCDEVYACVCQNCRHHFTFYIDRKNSTSCGLTRGNSKDPFHHLVLLATDNAAPATINKTLYPYHGHADYVCSAQACTFKLTVEVSKPRLLPRFLAFLTDHDGVRQRLAQALEREPERFADVADVPPNPLVILRVYLRDIVEGRNQDKNVNGASPGGGAAEVDRKIEHRNKKFLVQFGDGPISTELFTYLGFEAVVDGGHRAWKVPNPVITRPTRPGSQLAFYQDVKSEIETIIGKDSQNMKPNAAISFITNALDIGDYAVTAASASTLSDTYQPSDYRLLGLLPRMHEAYFFYAFACQRQTWPAREDDLFRSLQRLARGRSNEELEMRVQYLDSLRTQQPHQRALASASASSPPAAARVATEAEAAEEDEIRRATELSLQELKQQLGRPGAAASSSMADTPPGAATGAAAASLPSSGAGPHPPSGDSKVVAAYNYFGLPPDQRTDDEVLGKYESLSDAYPSQRSLYREKLLLIARHTDSRRLQEHATQGMGVDEAVGYLGVQADTETEYIVNIAQFACNSGEKDYALVASALRAIGAARDDDPTLAQAAAVVLAERGQGLGDDGGAAFAEPYATYGRMDIDAAGAGSTTARHEPVQLWLPVGLENIRNTCYLNSILQYLFTVKSVRGIVLNIDEYGLPDTAESLQNRRIDPGSTHLEKGEAYAGQQFVRQLALLFQDFLQSSEAALRPRQSLALAALKNPKQLETDGAKLLAREQEQQQSQAFDMGIRLHDNSSSSRRESPAAPPLPARHAPVPPASPASSVSGAPEATADLAGVAPSAAPGVAPDMAVAAAAAAARPTSLVSEVDPADSSSTRSSQTLVNQADESWQSGVPRVSVTMEELPSATHTEDVGAGSVEKADEADLPPPYAAVQSEAYALAGGSAEDPVDVDMSDAGAATSSSSVQATASGGVQIVFDPPPVAEPTVEQKIACALDDSSVTGTDQQDVEEVMGNIISHLRAAVRPSGEDAETGLQRDPITDTFFWTSVTYNRSNGAAQYNQQVAPNRWVTAYPDERGRVISLLQALDNSFQREFLTQGTTRYERFTSIRQLPPILHVHIQRTTRGGGKNNTAIDIPTALHLDRFMDSPVDAPLFARRRRAWNLQERIRSLQGPNGEAPALEFDEEAVLKTSQYTQALLAEYAAGAGAGAGRSGRKGKGKGVAGEAAAHVEATTNDEAAPKPTESDDQPMEEDKGPDKDDTDKADTNSPPASDAASDDYVVVNDEIKALLDENGIAIASTDALDEQLAAEVDVSVERTVAATGGVVDVAWMEEVRRLGDEANEANDADDADDADAAALQAGWVAEAAAIGDGLVARRAAKVAELEAELGGLFDDLQAPEHEYRLHAVVCHAGQTGKSGHYWVWVYDFARQLWRRYNDSTVTEEPDAAKVMRQLSTQGEPYYLAYVRAADVDRMVDVPLRAAYPPPPGPPPGHPGQPGQPEQPEQPGQQGASPGQLPEQLPGPPPPATSSTDDTAAAIRTGLSPSPPPTAATPSPELAPLTPPPEPQAPSS